MVFTKQENLILTDYIKPALSGRRAKKSHETKSQKTITPRTNCFVNYRDSVFLISINQVFNSKFTIMKILSNKAYRELIAEKELTELSLKSLKSKYDFIVEENKRLHLKNDLLHIEIKSLSEKAEKYDIYLQKSKARKAKARDKKNADDLALKKLATDNLGKKIREGEICGYCPENGYLIIGLKDIQGWSARKGHVILKKYSSYLYAGDWEVKY